MPTIIVSPALNFSVEDVLFFWESLYNVTGLLAFVSVSSPIVDDLNVFDFFLVVADICVDSLSANLVYDVISCLMLHFWYLGFCFFFLLKNNSSFFLSLISGFCLFRWVFTYFTERFFLSFKVWADINICDCPY